MQKYSSKWLTVATLLLLTLGGVALVHRRNSGPEWESAPGFPECRGCNLVVISLTNLRRSHVGLYGYKKSTTPNVDRFFEKAYRFERGFAPASLTYTDSLSLFWSRSPYLHGLHGRAPDIIEKSKKMLADRWSFPKILQQRGWTTAAFVSDEDYNFNYGLGPQFDLYFDRGHYPQHGIEFHSWRYNIKSKVLVEPALAWLEKNRTRPFFLFFQGYDLHCPWSPSDSFREKFDPGYRGAVDPTDCYMTTEPMRAVGEGKGRRWALGSWWALLERKPRTIYLADRDLEHLRRMYDGELAEADDTLKKFFQFLEEKRLLENTVVVFMSEHGDYLGENGYFMKSSLTLEGNLHNENLGFPLLMRVPGADGPRVIHSPFPSVDIAPTLLHILGVRHPGVAEFQGKSLVPWMAGREPVDAWAYSGGVRGRDNAGLFQFESMQNRDWKLMRRGPWPSGPGSEEWKLVDLKNDPAENKDLSSSRQDVLKDLQRKLEAARDEAQKEP